MVSGTLIVESKHQGNEFLKEVKRLVEFFLLESPAPSGPRRETMEDYLTQFGEVYAVSGVGVNVKHVDDDVPYLGISFFVGPVHFDVRAEQNGRGVDWTVVTDVPKKKGGSK